MEQKRIEEIDIVRGIAILFVYLGHSFIYYPINLSLMYEWCNISTSTINSFQMPLFFLISGFLFATNNKPILFVLKDKVIRLFIPYLTAMLIIIIAKTIIPGIAYHNIQGIENIVQDIFLYGGDRWFVYVLFVLFILVIFIKKYLLNKVFRLYLIIIIMITSTYFILPTIFTINKVFYYSVFFIVGIIFRDNYQNIVTIFSKRNIQWLIIVLFVSCNIVFVRQLAAIPIIGNYFVQIIGCVTIYFLSYKLSTKSYLSNISKKIIGFIKYAGKYSLQFYLLGFPFAIIRHIVINVVQLTNPYLIVLTIFVSQLLSIIVIIEITRKIKFLKVPLGY